MARWPKVSRSAGFRFALVHTGAFVLAVVVLGGLVEVAVRSALREQVRQRTEAELAALVDEFDHGGRVDLVVALNGRFAREGRNVDHAIIERNGSITVGDADLAGFVGSPNLEAQTISEIGGRPLPRTVIAAVRRLADGTTLVVADNLGSVSEVTAILNRAYLLAMILAIVLGLGLAFLLSKRLLARIDTVHHAAEGIIAGDLSRRIALNGSGDEFDRLAGTLNRMLDRIAGLIENLRQVTNDVAHDLRTPLTRLRQGLEAARRTDLARTAPEVIEHATTEIDEILAIFAALLRIAQIEAGARRAGFRRIDLSTILQTVGDAYEPAIEDDGRRLIRSAMPSALIEGDRELLEQLFANLIENVLQHTPSPSGLRIELVAEAAQVTASIVDEGPGIAAEDRDRVLRRFFRVDKSRASAGHGLGLALVSAIAELHSAALTLADAEPGLRVSLSFPLEAGRGSG